VFAWLVRLSLLTPAAAALAFAGTADGAWFERHVIVPAVYPGPLPSWVIPAVRGVFALIGLALVACAVAAGRRAKPDAAARVAVAVVLAVVAAEFGLRFLRRVVPTSPATVEAFLAAPDPRTGWSFLPRRTVALPVVGSGRVIHYGIDAHGDRAPSADWIEDTQAPTVLVAGESIAAGHALEWNEALPAHLGNLLQTQVVDVAESGYGSDQAYLRTIDALPRFAHPVAVVTTVLPVQLSRNIRDDRPHLVLRDGRLTLVPGSASNLLLRELWVNDLPYLGERDLDASLELTRSILHATAAAARARGAEPLFVFVPACGPRRAVDDHPEAFVIHALLDDLPHIVVDVPAERRLRGDGHPDGEAARQMAAAIVQALHH
jgi:hypothetical protein